MKPLYTTNYTNKPLSKKIFPRYSGRYIFWLLFLFVSQIENLSAASYIWTGATSNIWSDPTNWNLNNGTYPGQNSGDDVSIPFSANPPTLAATPGNSIASLTFTGVSGTFTINTGITLSVSGSVIINSIATSNISDTLTGSGVLNCNTFQIGSGTGGTANRNTILIFTLSNLNVSGNFILNSSFSTRRNNSRITHTSGTISVGGSVTTVNPNGANTSLYVMTNGGATLNLQSATPFNLSGTGNNTLTFTPASATVNYQSATGFILPTNITAYRNLTISGGGGNTKTLGTTTTVTGVLTVAAATTFDMAATGSGLATTSIVLETVGGGNGASITGSSGSLNIAAGGVTVNYTGTGAIISGATIGVDLIMTGNRNFTIANDGVSSAIDLTISSIISGTGTNNLTKLGNGQLLLTGSNSYTGNTIISAGSIICGADVLASTNGPLGNSANNIILGNPATASNNSSPALLTNGAFTIARPITIASQNTTGEFIIGSISDNNATYSGMITYNRSFKITQPATTAGHKLDFSGGMTGAAGIAKTITFDNIGTILVSAAINAGVNVSSVIKQNSGDLILETSNTYTGGTTLKSGTLFINNASALGNVTGTFTIAGGTIQNSSGSTITTVDYPMNWDGDFLFNGPQDIDLGAGAVTMSTDIHLTINSSNSLTIGGIINNNTLDLTKEGTGTLSFGSQNVALQNLIINGGTLVSTTGTLGLTGDFTILGSFAHNNGMVDFNGSGAQSIPGTDFFDLTISGDKGGANITLVNGNTIGLIDAFTVSAINASYIVTGNTFEYKGSGAQTITDFNYNDIVLSNTGIKTIQTGSTVSAKTLTINDPASINLEGTASLNID